MTKTGRVLLLSGSSCLAKSDGARAWAKARTSEALASLHPGDVVVTGALEDLAGILVQGALVRAGLRTVEFRADGHRYNSGHIGARWREGAPNGHSVQHVAMIRAVKDAIALGWSYSVTSVVAKWSASYAADNVGESARRLGLSAHVDFCPENMRRRKNGPEFPSVYFVQASTGHIKIGFSTKVHARGRVLQGAQPEKLVLLVSCPGSYAVERALHARFAKSRAEGEWFRPTPDLLNLIERLRTARMRRPLTVDDLLNDRLLSAA